MPDRFRADLRRIREGDEPLDMTETDAPASRGWLRRPEFDRPGVDAWERPDGALVGLASDRPAGSSDGKGATADR